MCRFVTTTTKKDEIEPSTRGGLCVVYPSHAEILITRTLPAPLVVPTLDEKNDNFRRKQENRSATNVAEMFDPPEVDRWP